MCARSGDDAARRLVEVQPGAGTRLVGDDGEQLLGGLRGAVLDQEVRRVAGRNESP